MRFLALLLIFSLIPVLAGEAYEIPKDHPRIFVNKAGLRELAARCTGPLQKEYQTLKQDADNAVRSASIRFIKNKWAVPCDLMSCGLAYLIERENGKPCQPYADVIIKAWGDGSIISNQGASAFGYHALAYDWIYDALSESQRKQYGDALGVWLKWYSNEAAITLKGGNWMYNQTWGPIHLNVMHSRDAIAQKLFISLAITGAGTSYESQAKSFLDSWNTRIPRDCIPAFDTMGGSWAESHGHGEYGPVPVVPYAFEAWNSATGQNWFKLGKPWSFLKEESRWLAYLTVPHTGRLAYLDDGGGSSYAGYHLAAPMAARALRDPLAQWITQQAAAQGKYKYDPWQRVVGLDPTLPAKSPAELKLPTAYLLKGVGHVFMRSRWDDPNATWAFFGAGPHYVGHQHDDEGHFMISRQGGLISKGGGQGGNDDDYYWGGSLVFNVLTIFDPQESFRRKEKNENDGGLLRHVYNNDTVERGSMVAYKHAERFTYAAADITAGYNKSKAAEVTRQFVFLRGKPGEDDYFVVFDRVQSTKAEYAKHFMLHVPEEPQLSGTPSAEKVPGHVVEYKGAGTVATWPSLPGDFGPEVPALSTGRSRLFMQTLLPESAVITKRGGAGHVNWGHPLEPTAQYDHTAERRKNPPICNWRLEVAAPTAERALFLHVFQVSDEGTKEMTSVKLLEKGAQVRLQVGNAWKVSFPSAGPLACEITPPGEIKPVTIGLGLDVEDQYKQWQSALDAIPAAK